MYICVTKAKEGQGEEAPDTGGGQLVSSKLCSSAQLLVF